MYGPADEERMVGADSGSGVREIVRSEINVSISIRTILLVAGVVAVAWALASIADVLLVIFVSLFGVAVLSPVVSAMERRLGWSRGWCSAVLVLATVLATGVL